MCVLLHDYTSPVNLEWLWNGVRLRHSMPPEMRSLLGSGTSPNEALHAEINRWFRNQPEVFPSTLALQLSVARLGKLLSHNSAMYTPTLRQMRQDTVLSATVAAVTLERDTWDNWVHSRAPVSAVRPLSWKRKALQRRIRAAGLRKPGRMYSRHVVRKRPARRILTKRPASAYRTPYIVVVKKPAAAVARPIKRTAFSLRRSHESLSAADGASAGVSSSTDRASRER